MVEQMGEKIRDLWHSEGGNGLYPPCSLHVSDEQLHNIAPSIVKGNLCLTFDTVFSAGFVEYLPFGYYLSLMFDTGFFLQALLSIYLLDDISLIDKHSVVLYALLDMVSLADPSAHDRVS